ncbi:MAG: tRNA (5-methylaminomethyl-2-thiouridylate)-methyltransferase, partial [Gammaproteobacteria bacterium]|nr:tRNA (5-methylaminomethyl-2-thiouridylate)-methyltransferase [Gammaproteobacteria bacterium]
LISGGLDSMLATKVVMDQGVHVEGINFFTGFCVEGHTHAIRKRDQKKEKRNNALWCAEQLGIKLHIVDVIEEYKDVLLNPKHGYGANLNPCQDCKTFMIHKALEWIQDHDFDFIITGEVVGQRPMSQRKDLMPVIARESGANDLLLRPLCAKNLPETKAEREGWVKRDELLGFSGRNRKPQMALAAQFGFKDYATPAGGCCFLTDENYSKKVVDMWEHRPSRDYELDDIMLLKVGRHIRPRDNFKMIVGREEGENKFMEGYRKQFISMYTTSHNGPLALLDGKDISDEDIELAARIVARFGQGKTAEQVTVEAKQPDGNIKEYTVEPMPPTQMPEEWYV